jgi:hypothetical protein
MMDGRRSVVVGIGTALLTTITGYLDTGGFPSDDDENDDREASAERRATPDPAVVGWAIPDPSLVWVDDEPVSGERHEFSAEIYNAGAPGTVGITLVWVDGQEGTLPDGAESTARQERFVEANERTELFLRSSAPDEYDAYDLQLWVSEFVVDVENDGESGRVEVALLEQDRRLDHTVVSVDAGETVPVAFDGAYTTVDPGDLTVAVQPVS